MTLSTRALFCLSALALVLFLGSVPALAQDEEPTAAPVPSTGDATAEDIDFAYNTLRVIPTPPDREG